MVVHTAPSATGPVAATCMIRPLQPGEGLEVRRIFRDTALLGQRLDLPYRDLVPYERLCLDWYLTVGRRHARVVDRGGEVVGYLLACLDQTAYEAWARPRAVRWAAACAARRATGRLRGDAWRFTVLRFRDGLEAHLHAPPAPFPAHAHLNLDGSVRDAGIGHRLAATMDDLVEAAGIAGWFGEINLPRGGSLRALERQGASVAHLMPNRTFSWLLGRPVQRATVARPLAHRPEPLRSRG